MPDILPGFSFDASAGRYRNRSTGRFVARSNITGLLRSNIDNAEARLGDLTTAFHEGRVSGSTYAVQMRDELRRLHLSNSALGAGGFDQLTQADFGRVGGRIRGDYSRVTDLVDGVQQGDVSLPQALQRVTGYVGNARTQFWDAERERSRPSNTGMILIERRMLAADAQHCSDCLSFYERGWTLQGQLPTPGSDSICRNNCRCRIKRREVPASEIGNWLGTKK